MRKASTVYFGNAAKNYEAERVGEMWRMEQDIIAPVLQSLLKVEDTVLDIAAGTGRWLNIYANAKVRTILLDISPDMLHVAEEKAKSIGYNVEIVVGNVVEMKSLPSSDWFISTRFFNWIPLRNIEKILQLALASGIKNFAITTRCLDETAPFRLRFKSLWYWQKKNLSVLLGTRPKGMYYLQSPALFRRMLAQINLDISQEHVIERARGDIYRLWILKERQP